MGFMCCFSGMHLPSLFNVSPRVYSKITTYPGMYLCSCFPLFTDCQSTMPVHVLTASCNSAWGKRTDSVNASLADFQPWPKGNEEKRHRLRSSAPWSTSASSFHFPSLTRSCVTHVEDLLRSQNASEVGLESSSAQCPFISLPRKR